MEKQRTADLASVIAHELMQKNGEVTIEAVREALEARHQIRGGTNLLAKIVRAVKDEAKKRAQQQFRRPDWPPQAEAMFDALLQHFANVAEEKFNDERDACHAERDQALARIQLVEQNAAGVEADAQKIEERNKLLAERVAHLQNQLAVAEQTAALAKEDAITARAESREAREMAERRVHEAQEMAERRVHEAQEAADARIAAEQKVAQQQKEFWANETHRQREAQREEHAKAIEAVKQQRDRLQARVDTQENELNTISRRAADASRDLAVKTGLYERLDADFRELKVAHQRNADELATAQRELIIWKQRARRAERRGAHETGQ